jgi:rod shape-determining protein MreB and related proteins
MLSSIQPTLYIQISPERVTVKNLKSGTVVSEPPEVATATSGSKSVVQAVGSQARLVAAAAASTTGQNASASITVINPFAHPRTLISDFTIADQLLKTLIRQALNKSLFTLAPVIVIHPLGSPAGGFTQVEYRAFLELAKGAGASKAFVWSGRPLTDQEVLSRSFPLAEGHLGS